jgi:hypothetical protein
MGIDSLLRSLFLVAMFIPLQSFSQQGSSYYWNNAGEKIALELIPNYVVEFAAVETDSKLTTQFKIQKPLAERKFPGARVLLLNPGAFNKAIAGQAKGGGARSSPIFKENGEIKGLAGGVFVYPQPGFDESKMKVLWQRLGLKVIKTYPEAGPVVMWLVEASPGLASLTLANTLAEEHSDLVLKARPNFWQPIETRELKQLLPVLPSRSLDVKGKKISKKTK